MTTSIVNYDGSITTAPQCIAYPETLEQLQEILRDRQAYPGPVRAKGSYHSLTPCASTDGTLVDMSRLAHIVDIDTDRQIITAQAGLQIIDASRALREHDLQLMTNIEIGNMTLGSAACCHSKDALDGVEFGQVSSYVTRIKWVTPAGELAEASEADSPDLLRNVRSSYGLCGIVYEVSLRVKSIEALHLTYLPRPVNELTQAEVDALLDTAEGLVCWTVGRTCVFQRRTRIEDAGKLGSLLADARRGLWNFGVAHVGHFIDQFVKSTTLRDNIQSLDLAAMNAVYAALHMVGGITILAPDKIIDYRSTPRSARYAFTFWAFPRAEWLSTLREYLDFADEHYRTNGFRCNMPLGAYYIRRDSSSLLSYTYDGDIFSIDPIHASTDDARWHDFLRKFNEFAFARNGIPLLNQSPFVERQHVEAAYAERWQTFSQWVRSMDPEGRMLNPFFAELLSP